MALYCHQLKELNYLRKNNFLEVFAEPKKIEINFDIEKMALLNYQCDPSEYYTAEPLLFDIHHDEHQIEKINTYINQYGRNVEGVGRILMRAPINKLFRGIKTLKYA